MKTESGPAVSEWLILFHMRELGVSSDSMEGSGL